MIFASFVALRSIGAAGEAGAFRYPFGVALSPDGDTLYVADQDAGELLSAPLSDPSNVSVLAQVESPDLLCAGPDGSVRDATSDDGGTANPPRVTTAQLPRGKVQVAYDQTLAASGGMMPYTWSISAGTLPAGLVLSADGHLSGTPTAAAIHSAGTKIARMPNTTTTPTTGWSGSPSGT